MPCNESVYSSLSSWVRAQYFCERPARQGAEKLPEKRSYFGVKARANLARWTTPRVAPQVVVLFAVLGFEMLLHCETF